MEVKTLHKSHIAKFGARFFTDIQKENCVDIGCELSASTNGNENF